MREQCRSDFQSRRSGAAMFPPSTGREQRAPERPNAFMWTTRSWRMNPHTDDNALGASRSEEATPMASRPQRALVHCSPRLGTIKSGRSKVPPRRRRTTPPAVALLATQIRALRLPSPEREHRFHATRRWRFDFAWPALKVAAEVEGGIWTGGRHVRGKGYESDCMKYSVAALAGWIVIRATPGMVHDGDAVLLVAAALVDRQQANVSTTEGTE